MRCLLVAAFTLPGMVSTVQAQTVAFAIPNDNGVAVMMSDETLLYLNRDCSASREGGGTGKWWNGASFRGVSVDGRIYKIDSEVGDLPFCPVPDQLTTTDTQNTVATQEVPTPSLNADSGILASGLGRDIQKVFDDLLTVCDIPTIASGDLTSPTANLIGYGPGTLTKTSDLASLYVSTPTDTESEHFAYIHLNNVASRKLIQCGVTTSFANHGHDEIARTVKAVVSARYGAELLGGVMPDSPDGDWTAFVMHGVVSEGTSATTVDIVNNSLQLNNITFAK